MDNWIKVERGIRYRERPTRKHGVPRHLDRYYVIRLAVDGICVKKPSAGSRRAPVNIRTPLK